MSVTPALVITDRSKRGAIDYSPRVKSFPTFVLAPILLATFACNEQINVAVNCVTTAVPAVECEVKQTKGTADVDVCWDFSVTCGNGAVVTAARTCQKVKMGMTEKTVIPADKLTGVDKCAGTTPPVGKLTNLTINGKASQ